jgi:hypothetical protein
MVWLWLSMRSEGYTDRLAPDQFELAKTSRVMLDILRDSAISPGKITDKKSQVMLPDVDLEWMLEDSSKRLSSWLLSQLEKEHDFRTNHGEQVTSTLKPDESCWTGSRARTVRGAANLLGLGFKTIAPILFAVASHSGTTPICCAFSTTSTTMTV